MMGESGFIHGKPRRPYKPRPRIEGMPAERPVCAWCSRKLKPVVDDERVPAKAYTGEPIQPGDIFAAESYTRRVWRRWDAYEGVFCTLLCSMRFAGAAYRGGYRRKGDR